MMIYYIGVEQKFSLMNLVEWVNIKGFNITFLK